MPVVEPFVPVTVWSPGTAAVQVESAHEPSGLMVKVVESVKSPRSFPDASNPRARYAWDSPGVMVAVAGESTKWSNGPASTCSDAVPVADPLVPVTVWSPGTVAVQVAPAHEPSGPMVKVVESVTSPRSLPHASNPCAR